MAAGDAAWWENPRPALGQVMSPQLPSACAASQLIGRDTAAPCEVPLLPAEHPVLPCGQIQSGCLAQMTHEGKEKRSGQRWPKSPITNLSDYGGCQLMLLLINSCSAQNGPGCAPLHTLLNIEMLICAHVSEPGVSPLSLGR